MKRITLHCVLGLIQSVKGLKRKKTGPSRNKGFCLWTWAETLTLSWVSSLQAVFCFCHFLAQTLEAPHCPHSRTQILYNGVQGPGLFLQLLSGSHFVLQPPRKNCPNKLSAVPRLRTPFLTIVILHIPFCLLRLSFWTCLWELNYFKVPIKGCCL